MTTAQKIKTAQTTFPVLDAIKNRWSPRAFANKPIADDAVMALVEAALWAPSSMNQQPWRYVYAHAGTPAFQQFLDCLLPGNALWCKKAAVLMLNIGYRQLDAFGVENPHFMHDCGMANANLFTQATSMDIYGHLLGGFDAEKTKATFQISAQEQPVCFIALGYLGDAEQLEEPFKTRELTPRQRRPLGEILEKWG